MVTETLWLTIASGGSLTSSGTSRPAARAWEPAASSSATRRNRERIAHLRGSGESYPGVINDRGVGRINETGASYEAVTVGKRSGLRSGVPFFRPPPAGRAENGSTVKLRHEMENEPARHSAGLIVGQGLFRVGYDTGRITIISGTPLGFRSPRPSTNAF